MRIKALLESGAPRAQGAESSPDPDKLMTKNVYPKDEVRAGPAINQGTWSADDFAFGIGIAIMASKVAELPSILALWSEPA